MKKLFGILIAIIVILAGLGTFAYLNSGAILAHIISHKTLTPITIHHIDWKKGGFTVEELTIKNPKEARLPVALNVRTIDVEAPYNKYFGPAQKAHSSV